MTCPIGMGGCKCDVMPGQYHIRRPDGGIDLVMVAPPEDLGPDPVTMRAGLKEETGYYMDGTLVFNATSQNGTYRAKVMMFDAGQREIVGMTYIGLQEMVRLGWIEPTTVLSDIMHQMLYDLSASNPMKDPE